MRELTQAADDFNRWQIPPKPLIPGWAASREDRAMLERRTTPNPLRCFTEKITLTGAEKTIRDRTYLICEEYRPSPFWPFYERYSKDPAWRTGRLPSLHDAMISIPDQVAQNLIDVAGRVFA